MSEATPSVPSAPHQNQLAAAFADMPQMIAADKYNPHRKNKYASADAVYSAIRNKLAEHGLHVFQDEVSFEIMKVDGLKGSWIKATYAFAIVSGIGPVPEEIKERCTMVRRLNDSQDLGSLRTYAIKYYLRNKLMLGTGDPDGDEDERVGGFDPARPQTCLLYTSPSPRDS